jgi:hypothetical protein
MYNYQHTCYWLWQCSKIYVYTVIRYYSRLTDRLGKQYDYAKSSKGWVHWCIDWVQMNPHAPLW